MRTDDRTVRLVVAIAVLALFARFVLLGSRVAHFDEGRVAWWGLDYLATGETSYRYIIHGPLMQFLHRYLFDWFGATDFVMRAPVALVGGLLPLVALWFRRHLSSVETVALAAALAVDPILLYYSRFARSTVLVAAFCFVSFAALVRWYDGDGVGYLYVAGAFLALGFGAKENAVVYVLCWFGAAGLLVAGTIIGPVPPVGRRVPVAGLLGGIRDRLRASPTRREWLADTGVHLAGAAAVAGLVVLFLFAPRGGDAGLWTGNLGATLDATYADLEAGLSHWFDQGNQKTVEEYRENLTRFVGTGAEYAGVLAGLAAFGLLSEVARREEARPLVLGCGYWGVASVVGYPLGTDIWGAWIIVNALVPLAVPAAAGLGVLVDIGRESLADDDRISAAIVALLLVLAVGQVAVVGVSAAFVDPTGPDNDLVQFAQPQQEMREPADRTVAVAGRHEGDPDVLFYGGDDFLAAGGFRDPACVEWTGTLPWAWYLGAADATVDCASHDEGPPEELPPVVVTEAECALDRPVECREATEELRAPDDLRDRIGDDYARYGFLHRTTGGNGFNGIVVFVDEDAAGQSPSARAFRSQRDPARR
ncbi:TIGR03663 family protein [Halobacteriales archaeon QS_9_68_42]|nr:MAG: TIGR03663 family protein [Halobacteriales archaeon QS_9_68_42]